MEEVKENPPEEKGKDHQDQNDLKEEPKEAAKEAAKEEPTVKEDLNTQDLSKDEPSAPAESPAPLVVETAVPSPLQNAPEPPAEKNELLVDDAAAIDEPKPSEDNGV